MDHQNFRPQRSPTSRRIDATRRDSSCAKGKSTSRSRISPVGLRGFRCLRQAQKRLLNEAARERIGLVQQRHRDRKVRGRRKRACEVPEGTSHAIGEKKRESETRW
ncbi:hypothetical protein CEJ98_37660 (plasmid) [Burkholderia gladioli pv. gladioli]|nr:hypothetical protein CEJ98_37660 [Burkholderia gladioli pv. gladioli]AWY49792.1 hypothetical protein A8H28_00565 [Burkholderia gladioli pv. gladioli]